MGRLKARESALARLVRQNGEADLVLICDATSENGLVDTLTQDGIPALGPGDFGAETIFPLDASPQQHLEFLLEELAGNWDQMKPTGLREDIQLAIITWPADMAGAINTEGLEEDVVLQAELPAEPGANVFDLIYQARDANANVIFTNARGFGLAMLLNALHNLGLWDRFVVAAPSSSYDAQLFAYLADPAFADGLYLTSTWEWWGEQDQPGIQAALALQPPVTLRDWSYLQMAGAVDVARRGLEDAILKDGFGQLGPESVLRAVGSIRNFPVLDGLAVVDYAKRPPSPGKLRLWRAGPNEGELQLVEVSK